MKVEERSYVSIDYRLSLESGEEVDRSPEGSPLGFVAGAGRIIPGLENALFGRESGESFKVVLEPEDGYGPVDDTLFQQVPRDRFPEGAEVAPGMAFQAMGPRGPVMMTVASVNDDGTVTMDLNHPMAGKKLFFDVTIVDVREPTQAELKASEVSSGCACGPSGEEEGGGGCGPGCACG